MKSLGVQTIGLFVASILTAGQAYSAGANNVDAEVREQLEQAKVVLQNAQQEAESIIRAAQAEARGIQNNSKGAATVGGLNMTPLDLQNTKVSVEISAGTVGEIVKAIMPTNWRILVDSKDAELTERRFQFVSTRTREQSLNDLLTPIGLKHQYFFDLKDQQGNPSPLLIVSSKN